MKDKVQSYSDEHLNAYLDNELAGEERTRLIEALRDNEALRQRVCKFEQVRNMVSIAYHDVPEPQNKIESQSRRISPYAGIAASILVVLGLVGGWFGHASFHKNDTGLIDLAENVLVQKPVGTVKPWNVLLHVTSNDPYRLNVLLTETENILREYEAKQQKVSIQILVNGKGLNLLRDDKSPYAKRIAELQSRYDNLVFMACAKAIARVQQRTGKSVPLLPETQIAPSALSEVLNRQREGWTYIKI